MRDPYTPAGNDTLQRQARLAIALAGRLWQSHWEARRDFWDAVRHELERHGEQASAAAAAGDWPRVGEDALKRGAAIGRAAVETALAARDEGLAILGEHFAAANEAALDGWRAWTATIARPAARVPAEPVEHPAARRRAA